MNRKEFKHTRVKGSGDVMQKSLGVVIIVLFVSLIQPLFCAEEEAIEWTFEPHTDRSVHIKAVFLLGENYVSYEIVGLSRELWIKNLKTYEYDTKKSIESEVVYDSETDTQSVALTFDEPTPENFRFVLEFDASDFLREEEEKTFIFHWNFGSEADKFNSAVVVLPKDAELLEAEYKTPKKVEENEQVYVYYEGVSGPSKRFEFQLTFSSSGKGYIRLGERYEESEQYDQAISNYQKAKSFYNRFDLYKKDKPKILGELKDRIYAIQKMQADSEFEKGTDAFEQKDYKKAKSHFEKAESLYTIVKDTQGEASCQEMIGECEKMEELKREADTLFEQGKTQYEAENYEEAKESFSQAKNKYEELEDTEKVSECDEWITKCEEADLGLVFCILGIFIVLLWRRYS